MPFMNGISLYHTLRRFPDLATVFFDEEIIDAVTALEEVEFAAPGHCRPWW